MTAGESVRSISERLKKAGIPSYRLDAELLVAHLLQIPPMRLLIDNKHTIPDEKIAELDKLSFRREKREPLAYITGTREFYSLDFTVNPSVLIPRPETEFLVETAVEAAPEGGKLLDVCTGSGAVAVAFKHERPDCEVSASDISAEALKLAKHNAKNILSEDRRINFYISDLFASIDGNYDVITANPPYIPFDERAELQPELSYEPEIALFAESEGMAFYLRILEEAPLYLTEKGVLILEIHSKKKEQIVSMAMKKKYTVEIINDYASLPRVAVLRLK